MSQETQTGALYQPRGVRWKGDGREVQNGGDICIPMGEFNSDDHYIYYCGQEYLRRNGVAIIVNKRV